MRILVLGASGGVGARFVRRAEAAGHRVTAVARRPWGWQPALGSRRVLSDIGDPALATCFEGQDLVVSCLGIRRQVPSHPWSRLMSPPDFSALAARRIVAAMVHAGVRRVLALSAAGVGDSATGLSWPLRQVVIRSNLSVVYRDLARMERVYEGSGLDWVCVRPAPLTDGPGTGRVRLVTRVGLLDRISRADVAAFLLAEACQLNLPETRFPQIAS